MVPVSMTLSDPRPKFQGVSIFKNQICQKLLQDTAIVTM